MTSPFLNAMEKQPKKTGSSPMAEKDNKSVLTNTLTASPVFAPAIVREVKQLPAMSLEEINSTGSKAGEQLRQISSEVLKHQRSNNGDELTERLNCLVKEARQLDPESIKNSKGLRKFFRKLLGMKEDIFAQFDTVQGRIDVLTGELVKDIKREEEGLRHLLKLKEGVAGYVLALDRDIELLKNNYQEELEIFEGLSDDEYESKSDKRGLLDLMETRINDLGALRLLMVQMGPRIKGMEETGRLLIDSGQKVIANVIPAYTAAFSSYVHSIRHKKAAEGMGNVITEFNTAIRLSGDLASQNQIQATELANRQLITLDTLKHDQQNLLTTLQAINAIKDKARTARVDYMEGLSNMEEGMIELIKQGVNAK